MKQLVNGIYEGERALYDIHNVEIISGTFQNGESPLKECSDLVISNSVFSYKYPLWYGRNFKVNNCTFNVLSRSGIWYTDNIEINSSIIYCPKLFRRCNKVSLNNCVLHDGSEMFWSTNDIKLNGVKVIKGDYMFKDCSNIEIDNFELNGNYAFDGAKNIVIRNSTLYSKDSFWNSENVTLIKCKVVGEYIGWNSKNLKFIDCEIESNQGFCYIDNLKLTNCTLNNTDLCFERCSNIDADIKSHVISIKNPYSGVIKVESVDEVILDTKVCDPNLTTIKIGKDNYEL